jgi:hypothetical protein
VVICPDRLGTNETKTQKERRPLSASDSAHGAVARGARPPAALRCPAPVMENAHTSTSTRVFAMVVASVSQGHGEKNELHWLGRL